MGRVPFSIGIRTTVTRGGITKLCVGLMFTETAAGARVWVMPTE